MLEHYLLAGAVGIVSALITSVVTAWLTGRRADSVRRREHFANALVAVTEYWEFPYVIRRRGVAEPEGERLRISTELRAVQQRIAFHEAWLRTESVKVSEAYEALVVETRRVAGSQMREAWTSEPVASDAEMNIVGIARGEIDSLRKAYLEAVRRRCSARGWLVG